VSAKKTQSDLLLTERALRDIADIERFSIEQWGKTTAAKYISDIEAAFSLLQENSALLRAEEDLHPELRFHRVNKHVLVCDVQQDTIFLLTVIHASRDIPSRLAEMQPSLMMEIELLHQRLANGKKR
jgi:toxin ParE1/3/4